MRNTLGLRRAGAGGTGTGVHGVATVLRVASTGVDGGCLWSGRAFRCVVVPRAPCVCLPHQPGAETAWPLRNACRSEANCCSGLVAHLQIRMESSPQNVAQGLWPRLRQRQHAVIAADHVFELRAVLCLEVRMARKHFIQHDARSPKIRAGVDLPGEQPLG